MPLFISNLPKTRLRREMGMYLEHLSKGMKPCITVRNWSSSMYRSRVCSTARQIWHCSLSLWAAGLRANWETWGMFLELRAALLGKAAAVPREWKCAAARIPSHWLRQKKDSREIRSKDFLSLAFGFTWQVRRFSLAGCLLGWNREKAKLSVAHPLTCRLSALWGRRVVSGRTFEKSYLIH